ncbi:hypothetical protein SAMN04487846_2255 [Microbacterium sp. cf046]|uniref:hypothetical protein n=1 Tax=Microbacterium sp. cf046 TaxID=1761803 RepID=UPI0008E6F9B3|nr:hypothetical protein [Microbacterium sp. cf046]SFS07573.1 hypothetical protein SAMN04487846_2255 [Microbacterium sp. cf046]
MLFVFLALYVALGIGCIVLGARRHKRLSVICGVVALALALASLVVWVLSSIGTAHWSVDFLESLLSPMPESLLDPGSLQDASQGGGVPVIVLAVIELIVAIGLWAIPGLGLVAAGRAPRTEPAG